jgi:hypothetical protein
MGNRESIDHPAVLLEADDTLGPLLAARPVQLAPVLPEAVIGELIAFVDDGQTPLVRYPGQPGTAAVPARCVPDLHAAHIGRSVVLSFEGGDAARPIVMGVLRAAATPATEGAGPGQVQVDVDGERLVVSAREQLVLQCGKASITLTRAGKVLIQGSYVSSRSSGVNRILGGSVQLN